MSHLFLGAHSEEVILGPGPCYAEEILKRRLHSENASNDCFPFTLHYAWEI